MIDLNRRISETDVNIVPAKPGWSHEIHELIKKRIPMTISFTRDLPIK